MSTDQPESEIGHLVVVHWEDTTNVAEWQSHQEVLEFASDGAWICENVGWVLVDNDDCIVLSGRRAGKIGQFGLTERIPKRNVLAVQRLAVVEPDPLRIDEKVSDATLHPTDT
jgi:hypothetical protein